MNTSIIRRAAVLLLLAALAAALLAGCGGRKKDADRGICIAYTDMEISKQFAQTLNPLYAENDIEFALGTLIAPTIMEYEEGKGWIPVLGNIEVAVEDGVTVATVTLNSSLKYNNYNRQAIKADSYKRVFERILRTNYFGYYEEFYKNPIEGLVEFKYDSKGLKLEDVPDFNAQLDEIFSSLDADAYRAMLLETDVAGLYGSEKSPDSICPDGRSFKEMVMEETKDGAAKDASFYVGITRGTFLPLLADVYAAKDRSEWMLKELRTYKHAELQDAFAQSCRSAGYDHCQAVSGLRAVGGGYTPTGWKVYFTKIVEENEAIAMLNLPIINSITLEKNTIAIGAGSFTYGSVTETPDGRVITLMNGRDKLLVTSVDRAFVSSTLYMRQISAAVLSAEPTEAEKAEFEKNGQVFFGTGAFYVLYDPSVIAKETLEEYSMMFT